MHWYGDEYGSRMEHEVWDWSSRISDIIKLGMAGIIMTPKRYYNHTCFNWRDFVCLKAQENSGIWWKCVSQRSKTDIFDKFKEISQKTCLPITNLSQPSQVMPSHTNVTIWIVDFELHIHMCHNQTFHVFKVGIGQWHHLICHCQKKKNQSGVCQKQVNRETPIRYKTKLGESQLQDCLKRGLCRHCDWSATSPATTRA